jgi:IrrE N-terminal-like domain
MDGVPDVIEVARELRLKIKEEGLVGCDGVLIRPGGVNRGIIAVRRDIRSAGRKRFTIAHEIGHYVLPGHDEDGAICRPGDIEGWGNGASEKERQADDFAAEFLLPAAVVSSRIVAKSSSLESIELIADVCGTSLAASAWRYCDLTSEQCAIVWSENGKVAWTKASLDFPFFIQRGKPVEGRSYASNCFRDENVPVHPESVPADAWIDSTNLVDGARIYEESRALPSYGSVLTLLWIKGNIQKKTEYDDDEGDPLDPEDFTVHRKRWPK